MTSPRDPNQPGWGDLQPETPQPLGQPPAEGPPPGWGQPPAGGSPPGWRQPQPGWGPPPAGGPQPGWGQPQPGWGPPPAGGPPPGWGQPQPGWGPPPNPPRSFVRRHGCLLSFVVVLGLISVLVVGCVITIGPTVGMDLKLMTDLQPNANQVEFQMVNGGTTWVIHVAPGHESQAADLACRIVKPDLAGTQFANDRFQLIDSRGQILADQNTPCS